MENKAKIILPNALFFDQVRQRLAEGKSVIIPVKGNSMMPFLKEGERLVLVPFELPIEQQDLRKGTIVLAKKDDQMLLHRVVKIKGKRIWLAGDANLVQHEGVELSDILALVDSVIREDKSFRLNKRTTNIMGMLWYWARPLRRIIRKMRVTN